MNKYVLQLSEIQIEEIKKRLIKQGILGEDLENALNSRLHDLEEVINIKEIIAIGEIEK